MALKFSDAATSTITTSVNTSATSIVVESVASFPQSMIAGDYFIAIIANTENTVRETVKVTAINYSTKTMTVVRGYDNTLPIAWSIGSKIEIRGGSALFKEIINTSVSAPETASDNQLLRFDGVNNKAQASLITADDNGNLVCPSITISTGGLNVNSNNVIDNNGNITFSGTATTINQNRGLFWTAYDKEGTSDFSDAAYIRHTINSGGLSGSVLEISSLNDAEDGVNVIVPSSNGARVNGNPMWHTGNQTTSFSGNGYIKFPNGLIIQWCTGGGVASESDTTTYFPIAFPNACLNVIVGTYMPSGDRDSMFQMRYYDNSSVTSRLNQFNAAGGTGYPTVFAVGY